MKLLKYFIAGSNVSKYSMIIYAATLFLSSGLAVIGPSSLFSIKVFPAIANYTTQHTEALITLAILWGINSLAARLVSRIKFVMQCGLLLAATAALLLAFWFLFVRPAAGA